MYCSGYSARASRRRALTLSTTDSPKLATWASSRTRTSLTNPCSRSGSKPPSLGSAASMRPKTDAHQARSSSRPIRSPSIRLRRRSSTSSPNPRSCSSPRTLSLCGTKRAPLASSAKASSVGHSSSSAIDPRSPNVCSRYGAHTASKSSVAARVSAQLSRPSGMVGHGSSSRDADNHWWRHS